MKILQILPELNAGGVERCVVETASFLARTGNQSIVVSHGGRLVPALQQAGARHIELAVHQKSLLSILKVGSLRRILEQERPDILHIHSRLPGWIAWLAWKKLDQQLQPGLVSTVHGFYSVNPYSSVMTRGERVIAVSRSVDNYIRTSYSNVRPEAIRLIPHGVDSKEYFRGFQPDAEWSKRWIEGNPRLAGKAALLLPGRITRLKGHIDFLRLITSLRKAHVPAHGLIVGDTHPRKRAYLAELKSITENLAISDDVTFIGNRTDLREIMAVSRIVFSLSTQPESFGLTTLEALALGRPVVGYAHGGVGEQLESVFPQGMVPVGDSAALHEITRRVLSSDDSPRPIPEIYTLEAMLARTASVYQELSSGRRAEKPVNVETT